MLIDLHCHTQPLSQCSALRVEELTDLARERGLDGLCLTEHDTAWDAQHLAAARRRTGFLLLAGVEFTTDHGHVLAYGLRSMSAHFATLPPLMAAARRDEALLFLAHPARDGLLKLSSQARRCFASIETVNGSDTLLQNTSTAGLAALFELPGIGGSDAHTAAEVGRAATRFEAHVADEESLLAALRSGAYEALHLARAARA